MRVESFGASDIGLVRTNNEDVWAHNPLHDFFILADGMGGHQAGEIAANETVIQLCNWIEEQFAPHKTSLSGEEWIPHLEQAILTTNQWVHQLSVQDAELTGMGTTLCLALLINTTLLFAHVGDSRIYRIRNRRISRLTTDHSLREEMLANGRYEASRSQPFPYKNVLTRAMGTHSRVIPDIQTTQVEKGDLYFLCSDGLTDCLSDKEILSTALEESSLQALTLRLIHHAKQRGAPDNITIVMFQIL